MQRKRRGHEARPEIPPVDQQWSMIIRQSNRPLNPPTDVIEYADRVVVIVEIAGVHTSDLNITLLDRQLVITGTRDQPQHPDRAFHHRMEIGFGAFHIEVPLPWAVERETVTASYENGFLQVDLPRKSARQIQVIDVADDQLG